jgi:hypothetical protein
VIVVSASITAFILALTAAAVYAYRNTPGSSVAVQQLPSQPQSQAASSLQLAAPPVMAQVSNVAPQDAASIAAKALNRTDLYSIELADYQGTQAYKVTFSSGDIVYVGLDGKVLGSEVPPAPVFVTQSGGAGGGSSQSGHTRGSGGGESGEHEEHEGEGD